MFENFRIAYISLTSNRLRTALTTLEIMIGVASVIVLLSVGQAFDIFLRDQFEGLGVGLVIIIPNFSNPAEFRPLTVSDVEALADRSRVPDARRVMGQDNTTRAVKFGNREIRSEIQGVTTEYLDLTNRRILAGRFFDERDMETRARVALVEPGLVASLFDGIYPIGQSVRVDDVRFTIIGVMGDENVETFGARNGLVVPITTVQTRLSGERVLSGDRQVDWITVQAWDAESVPDVAQQIRQTLREEHEINFRGEEDDFIVITQTEVLDTLGSITSLVTVFLVVLASISLLVGGIGIMNIMLVTVTERTKEIGLRKAVGAQQGEILLQFLTEAVLIALLGGAMGVALALLSSLLVSSFIAQLNVVVQFSSIILATVISIAVGVLSGIYPANRAASLNPITALRYE